MFTSKYTSVSWDWTYDLCAANAMLYQLSYTNPRLACTLNPLIHKSEVSLAWRTVVYQNFEKETPLLLDSRSVWEGTNGFQKSFFSLYLQIRRSTLLRWAHLMYSIVFALIKYMWIIHKSCCFIDIWHLWSAHTLNHYSKSWRKSRQHHLLRPRGLASSFLFCASHVLL